MSAFSLVSVAYPKQGGPPYGPPPPPGGWTFQIIPMGQCASIWTGLPYDGSGGWPWAQIIETPSGTFIIPNTSTFGGVIGPSAGTQNSSTSGSYKVRATWTGSAETRPEKLSILETSSASYSSRDGNGSAGSGAASNGIHPMVPTTFPGVLGAIPGGKSEGKRVVQLKITDSITEYTSNSLNANSQTSVANGLFGEFHVGTSFTAVQDPRAVSISRGGRYEWYDSNLVGHGDTIYSYLSQLTSTGLISNDVIFGASIAGPWGAPLNWTWAGGSSIISQYQFSCIDRMPIGTPYEVLAYGGPVWQGSPTGISESTITYKLTDPSDGATADASYVLKIHDRFESFEKLPVYGTYEESQHPNGHIVTGPKAQHEMPIDEEYNVTQGGTWTFSLGTNQSELVKWFPVFGIAYNTNPVVIVRHVTWSKPIDDGKHLRLYTRVSYNNRVFKYYEYDSMGQIRAYPTDGSIKTTSAAKQRVDETLFWKEHLNTEGF